MGPEVDEIYNTFINTFGVQVSPNEPGTSNATETDHSVGF